MMAKKRSRHVLTLMAFALVAVALGFAFWPRATLVDIGTVSLRNLQVTITEEGRTRVHDAYTVSAPITGRLLRVTAEPGDVVVQGETVLAQLLPVSPALLDVRTREQARAAVAAAEAGLRMARADWNKSVADEELALKEQARLATLLQQNIATQAQYDQAERNLRAAQAAKNTAQAAIAMREAELAMARTRLIEFNHDPAGDLVGYRDMTPMALKAPIDGQVLQVLQKSETTVTAGAPILEIGDTGNDLELVVELLSSDAVQVEPGNPVIISNWGGEENLTGVVERIEPWGFTKYSALGVEEQRVNTIVQFTGEAEAREKLGHGYRVEVSFIIWQQQQTLTLPASALFREADQWAVFVVSDHQVRKQPVQIGKSNGQYAQVLSGVSEGDQVVLYPGLDLLDGMRVENRRGRFL